MSMFDPARGGGRVVAALLTPAGADRLQLQASIGSEAVALSATLAVQSG
jgi:hypothetical protein